MGLVWTTAKVMFALIIFYAGLRIIETNFAILGQWYNSIFQLQQSGKIPGEVWGLLLIIGFFVFMKVADEYLT